MNQALFLKAKPCQSLTWCVYNNREIWLKDIQIANRLNKQPETTTTNAQLLQSKRESRLLFSCE